MEKGNKVENRNGEGINKRSAADRYNELKDKLLDFATLDVITAKGIFEIETVQGNVDLVDAISKPPKSLTILARTHMQIDGDRCEIIPTEGVGTLSQEQIATFHKEAVDSALNSRQKKFDLLVAILDGIRDRFPDIPKQAELISKSNEKIRT